jgi:hypothetical protein
MYNKHLLHLTTTSRIKLSPGQPLQGSESETDTHLVPLEQTLHHTSAYYWLFGIRFICSIWFFGCGILVLVVSLVSILGSELTYRCGLGINTQNYADDAMIPSLLAVPK